MTPWGVFFLACKLPYTKCWLLCQQAHGGQKSSEDKSISIHDCAEFATRPGTGEHPRPPGGSGCHNSAGLRSSPASLWEGVSKFHYPPRCRRARLARAGSKVRADRSAHFSHLLERAVLAARLLSLFTQVLCLEYCVFSCSQCISPPYLSGGLEAVCCSLSI